MSDLRECKNAFESWYTMRFGALPKKKLVSDDYHWDCDRNRFEVWCAAWNALEEVNFMLSAGQCVHPGGVIAGENGDALCPLTRADATIAKVLEECKEWERKAESMENMETISSVYYLHTARSIRSVARCIKRIIERGE